MEAWNFHVRAAASHDAFTRCILLDLVDPLLSLGKALRVRRIVAHQGRVGVTKVHPVEDHH